MREGRERRDRERERKYGVFRNKFGIKRRGVIV